MEQVKRPFQMSTGDQVRDFCAVQDISCAVLRCIERGPGGRIEKFNLGSGITGTVRQLVERVRHELDLSVDIQFGARPYLPHEPMYLVPDTGAALKSLGWQAQTNVAFAVWELAQDSFPQLKVRKPAQGIQ
jgi:nucleoside-diphosphate-sugar epimerase